MHEQSALSGRKKSLQAKIIFCNYDLYIRDVLHRGLVMFDVDLV